MFNPYLGLEAIRHQHDSPLGKELEEAISAIRAESNTLRAAKEYDLGKIIQRHTGMMIDFKVGEENVLNAWVMVPDMGPSSPVILKIQRGFLEGKETKKLMRREELISGTVDLTRGRVTGIFTKVRIEMCLNIPWLKSNSPVTAEMATAILLHEIGHAFTYFEFFGRRAHTNFILDEGVRQLLEAPDEVRKTIIVRDIAKATGVSESAISPLVTARDRNQATILLTSELNAEMRNELGGDPYHWRGFEKLADQFAARMGYAEPLALALDVIYRTYSPTVYRKRWAFYLLEALELIGMLMAANVLLLVLLPIVLIWPGELYAIYDAPKRRMESIRNELIAALKEMSPRRKDKIRLLESVDRVQSIIDEMNDYDSILFKMATLLVPRNGRYKRFADLQMSLEDMMASRLYVESTRLQQHI